MKNLDRWTASGPFAALDASLMRFVVELEPEMWHIVFLHSPGDTARIIAEHIASRKAPALKLAGKKTENEPRKE